MISMIYQRENIENAPLGFASELADNLAINLLGGEIHRLANGLVYRLILQFRLLNTLDACLFSVVGLYCNLHDVDNLICMEKCGPINHDLSI